MDIQGGIIDTKDSKRWEDGWEMKVEKLPIGYNVHYSGDGCTKNPDFNTHVRNLCLYPLNRQKFLKVQRSSLKKCDHVFLAEIHTHIHT